LGQGELGLSNGYFQTVKSEIIKIKKNYGFEIKNVNGQIDKYPYEVQPGVLFELSQSVENLDT
jgi:hypothetical protein